MGWPPPAVASVPRSRRRGGRVADLGGLAPARGGESAKISPRGRPVRSWRLGHRPRWWRCQGLFVVAGGRGSWWLAPVCGGGGAKISPRWSAGEILEAWPPSAVVAVPRSRRRGWRLRILEAWPPPGVVAVPRSGRRGWRLQILEGRLPCAVVRAPRSRCGGRPVRSWRLGHRPRWWRCQDLVVVAGGRGSWWVGHRPGWWRCQDFDGGAGGRGSRFFLPALSVARLAVSSGGPFRDLAAAGVQRSWKIVGAMTPLIFQDL